MEELGDSENAVRASRVGFAAEKSGNGELPVRVDREGAVRLLDAEEEAIDVGAMDGGVGSEDGERVHSGISDHGVRILGNEGRRGRDTSRWLPA